MSDAHEPVVPAADCGLCPRLKKFREANFTAYPNFHNAPVDAFGPLSASLLIVGLAPGLKGANRTGRPFTGDYAGDLLYPTLVKYRLAKGQYEREPTDGVLLSGCRITNAVRCVPPQNKVTAAEETACRPFLVEEISAMKNLKVILALGVVSHGAILVALGEKKSSFKFAHAAQHELGNGLILANSYHCSRYNTNTGRLTEAMFHEVFEKLP